MTAIGFLQDVVSCFAALSPGDSGAASRFGLNLPLFPICGRSGFGVHNKRYMCSFLGVGKLLSLPHNCACSFLPCLLLFGRVPGFICFMCYVDNGLSCTISFIAVMGIFGGLDYR